MSYWDAHPKRYDPVVYEAGKCALHDLRRLLGTTTMAALLRRYAQTHWYGISTTADFKAAAQSVTATDLSDFWHRHRIDG
jgi:aminopeptidase N